MSTAMTIEEKRKRAEELRGQVKAAEISEADKLDREITRLELEVTEKAAEARVHALRAEAEKHILDAQLNYGTIAEGKIAAVDSYGDIVIVRAPDEGHFMMSIQQVEKAPTLGAKMDIERELVISCLIWCTGTKSEIVGAPASNALSKEAAFQALLDKRPGLLLAVSQAIGKLAGNTAAERAGK